MAEKSPTAFRTISEVSEELGVPQHVLRFWEGKFPAVKPMKRGGNRRYYRPDDVELLRTINRLLYSDGYTIKGVQKLLRERGAADLPAAGTMLATDAAPATVAPVSAPAFDRNAELRAIRDLLVTALAA